MKEGVDKFERVNVKLEKEGVVQVILSNPEKRNAIDDKMIHEIISIFSGNEILNDDKAKVVVIEGEGNFFCAGGDLKWMMSKGRDTFEENLRDSRALAQMYMKIWECQFPVICVVRGGAHGGGLGFLAVSDIVITDENAKFRLPEVKIGLVPAVVSVFLSTKINVSYLAFYAITGKEFSAYEAKSIGLVNIICPEEKIEELKSDLIREISSSSIYAVKRTKELIRKISRLDNEILDMASEFIAEARSRTEAQMKIEEFFKRRKTK